MHGTMIIDIPPSTMPITAGVNPLVFGLRERLMPMIPKITPSNPPITGMTNPSTPQTSAAIAMPLGCCGPVCIAGPRYPIGAAGGGIAPGCIAKFAGTVKGF